MVDIKQVVFALCQFWGMHALAHAQSKQGESRGELLYATHCSACHTSEIHWREQKLATDWSSLRVQVRRWQTNIGLNWNEEEIADVVHYLNAAYYDFPNTGQEDFSQGKKPKQALHKY
ncbi:MAG: cytochrome c [Gallionella sp.]|nr:cytochrome c [Gallionella sp.]